jgi:transposase
MKNFPLIQLPDAEAQQLKTLATTGRERARVLTRARILLLAADYSRSHLAPGQRRSTAPRDIAAALQIHPRTVSRTCQRYVAAGLDAALYDRPRSGHPVEITGEVEAKLTMLACSTPPDGHDHWTLQLLADKMVELEYIEHISNVAVMQHLKKTNCAHGRSRAGVSRP